MYNFATVSIDLGRETGKTYYINYKNQYNKDVVLTAYNGYKRYSDYDHTCNIIDVHKNFHMASFYGHFNGKDKPDTIWVDDASKIDYRTLDEILCYLYTDKKQTVVKLG